MRTKKQEREKVKAYFERKKREGYVRLYVWTGSPRCESPNCPHEERKKRIAETPQQKSERKAQERKQLRRTAEQEALAQFEQETGITL